MNPRKWLALAASVSLVALLTAGLSVAAQDEEEEVKLEKLMEDVSAANNRINRYVRTPVAFRKYQEDIVKYSKDLVDLGKKAKESEEALEDVPEDIENPKEKWEELMDDFIETSEELAKMSEEGDQQKARDAHTEVKKACAECHKVFRIEDDF